MDKILNLIENQKPFISILTSTYNRADGLIKAYESILENTRWGVTIEWLIMDDGSVDDTEYLVKQFKEVPNLKIQYFYQRNSGKMTAINKLVELAKGKFIIELDSDDYLTYDAIKKIKENCFILPNIYGFVFLKAYRNDKIMGKKFKNPGCNTTIFETTFIDNIEGEKIIVYNTEIRKLFEHKLENNEKYIIDSRLHHQMDKEYEVFTFNEVLEYCTYSKDSYTNNIEKISMENPYGYYMYFKELLEFDLTYVKNTKKLYIYNQYILYTILTKQKLDLSTVANLKSKIQLILIYISKIFDIKRKGFVKHMQVEFNKKNTINQIVTEKQKKENIARGLEKENTEERLERLINENKRKK